MQFFRSLYKKVCNLSCKFYLEISCANRTKQNGANFSMHALLQPLRPVHCNCFKYLQVTLVSKQAVELCLLKMHSLLSLLKKKRKEKCISGNPISLVYLLFHLQDVNLSNTFPYAVCNHKGIAEKALECD